MIRTKIKNIGNKTIIEGTVKNIFGTHMKFWAANKVERRFSFSGSGLPLPSEKIAFENSPNRGVTKLVLGNFKIIIDKPSSYYTNLGSKYVPSKLYYCFCDSKYQDVSKVYSLILGIGVPYRSLNYNESGYRKKGAMGYLNNELEYLPQWKLLVKTGFPKNNKQSENYWGVKPPV